MALKFIIGGSGSGKSTLLHQTLIEASIQHPEKKFLLIVPEQFSLETQRDLVAAHPGHSLMNLDILTFQRLAHRMMEEAGDAGRKILDDAGKNFILRNVVDKHKDEFVVFGRNLNRSGMIDELKSFLSEMMQYDLMPQDLLRMSQEASEGALSLKLQDLHLIYTSFLEEIGDRYLTVEGVLSRVSELAGSSQLIKDAVIAFDGYTGFTPLQNKLLAELMHVASRVLVTVTIDPKEDLMRTGKKEDLFYLSRKTIRQLSGYANDAGMEIEVIKCGSAKEKRFVDAPQLAHLEAHLFRSMPVDYEGKTDAILISEQENPEAELRYAASQIRMLCDKGQAKYLDFAVVTGDTASYESLMERVFAEYEIPVFNDKTKRLLVHPVTEALRGMLSMFADGYAYRSVFTYLRGGFSGFEEDEIDLMENYVLARDVRGSKWQREWKSPDGNEEKTAALEALRRRFVEQMQPLAQVLCQKEATIREKNIALYTYLTQTQMPEKLAKIAAQLKEEKDLVRAREYEQVFMLTMQVFEKLTDLLGERKVSQSEYLRLFEAGCEAVTLRVTPPRENVVVFGDIERTRLSHIKTLFLIGANDGTLPKLSSGSKILSDFEREMLKDSGEELADTEREQALLQNFYLYLNLTKPSQRLVITYAAAGSKGEVLRRAFLITVLQKLYPQIEIQTDAQREEQLTAESSLIAFAEQMRQMAAEPSENRQLLALAAYYLQEDKWRPIANGILEAAYLSNRDRRLSQASVQALYGEVLAGSVSKLEAYRRCAYRYFLAYGLDLREREIASFEPTDMGSLYHDAIAHFSSQIQLQNLRYEDLTEQDLDRLTDDAMHAAYEMMRENAVLEEAQIQYRIRRMKRVLKRSASMVVEQIRIGTFRPTALEQDFAVDIVLPKSGKTMRLKGRVDRLDEAQAGDDRLLRIVDYKTSAKELRLEEIADGTALQLAVYLETMRTLMQEANPDEQITASGMLYYALEDPMYAMEKPESDAAIAAERVKALKMRGLIMNRKDVLDATDGEGVAELMPVRVKLKKDSGVYKSSEVLPQKAFYNVLSYAKQRAMQSAEEILDGHIQIHPTENSCKYCPYGAVCGFDQKMKHFEYRKNPFKGMDKEGILERMKPEGEEEADELDT